MYNYEKSFGHVLILQILSFNILFQVKVDV